MKNNWTKLAILVGVLLVVFFGGRFLMVLSYNRSDVQLRNLIKSKNKMVETTFDNMYRTIKDQAGITNNYSEKLKELVLGTMQGRYATGEKGKLMLWVQEQNPTLDSKVFTTLMNTVEAKRNEFKSAQDELISAYNEHENLIHDPWKKRFLDDTSTVEITIIASPETKDTIKSGVDNTDPINGK